MEATNRNVAARGSAYLARVNFSGLILGNGDHGAFAAIGCGAVGRFDERRETRSPLALVEGDVEGELR